MSERLDPQMMGLIRQDRMRTGPHPSVKIRVLARVQASFAKSPITTFRRASSGFVVHRVSSGAMRNAMLALTFVGVVVGATTAGRMFVARRSTLFRSGEGLRTSFSPFSTSRTPASSSPPWRNPRSSGLVPPGPSDASAPTGERALLDRARASLLHGDALAALEAVAEHAARFPQGALSEERAAIRVEALEAAGCQHNACTADGSATATSDRR